MDIWSWVVDYASELARTGNLRLAQLLMKIPEATCDDRHVEVDAMVPEALALVRMQKKPWAELYVRHWNLQSKVLHRHEVKDNLAEAVSLLEFASRAETRDCPQSVCVTQDLACAYGDLDGPGYVEERLAVSAETLSRIDPSWPCFDCISGERAAALMDGGRMEETLAFIEEQRRKLASHEIFQLGGNLARRRAMALLALGLVEEALAQIDEWDAHEEGKYRELSKRIHKARVLVRMKRGEEALALFPAAEELGETADLYEEWLTAVVELVEADLLPNTWKLGAVAQAMHRKLEENGALYLSVWSAVTCARLALRRGAVHLAELAVEAARIGLPRLRQPSVIAGEIRALEAALGENRGATPEMPDTVDALIDRCGSNPEADLAILEAAQRRWPADERVVVQYANALRAVEHPRRAEEALRKFLAREPGSVAVLELLGESYLGGGRSEELLAVLDAMEQDAPAERLLPSVSTRALLRARAYRARNDLDRCRAVLRGLITDDPELRQSADAALFLAKLDRERGAYEEALAVLDRLAEAFDPGSQDWERMIVGALLRRWEVVRHSARRLGMDIDGEGFIDRSDGLCRVQVRSASGRTDTFYAERISPVTARIVEIAGPDRGDRECYKDVVVILPAPLNASGTSDSGDSSGSNDEERVHVYPVIETLDHGGYQGHALDGVHPGDGAYASLVSDLAELGIAVQLRSGPSYELSLEDEVLQGLYAFMAVPESVAPAQLHELLSKATASWSHPIIWPSIARTLGDEVTIARQQEIAVRYGL